MCDVLAKSDTIFHYTKKTVGMEHILTNMSLRFGLYSKTNDPHEYHDRLTSAVLDGDRYNADIFESLSEIYAKHLRNTKIACFCRNVPERKDFYPAYEKTRMWSQYGGDHEGLCIAFSKEKLLSQVKEETKHVYSGNVKYFRKRERLGISTHFMEDPLLDTDQFEYIKKHIAKNHQEMFLMKHIDYRDEDECRIIIVDSEIHDVFVNISDAIIGVIVGDRFPEIYEQTVIKLCRENGIDCYRYKFKEFQPTLSRLYD